MGLGTWKSSEAEIAESLPGALGDGSSISYPLLDCANDYGNEHAIGKVLSSLREKGLPLPKIQAKLWNANLPPSRVRGDLEATLKDLGLPKIDTFLIHWPQACPCVPGKDVGVARRDSPGGPVQGPASVDGTMFPVVEDGHYAIDKDTHWADSWREMEKLVAEGLVDHLGVCNFNSTQLLELINLPGRKVAISVVQSERHPLLHEKDLVQLCKNHGIVFQAYSPLGSGDRPWLGRGPPPTGTEVLKDQRILAIAEKHNRSAAQVVLRWHYQCGVATVPKSKSPKRLAENLAALDGSFVLDDEDMAAFDSMHVGWRHCLWPETSRHPDYPFKDYLPHDYETPKPQGLTSKPGE